MTIAARLPAALLLLSALSLAGCSTVAHTATTHLALHFAGHGTDVAADVKSDLATRPTAARYRADNIPHPDGYTAHDQLEDWSTRSGHSYSATPYNGSFGAGYFLNAIDGARPDGTTAYWSLALNGKDSDTGMSDLVLHDGDQVTWTWTSVAAPASGTATSTAPAPAPHAPMRPATPPSSTGSAALTLVLDPPQPTKDAAIVLTGTVSRDASVAVRGGPSTQAKAGAWSLGVPLPYGHSNLTIVADDGADSSTLTVTAIRLASGTFEAKYTAYPVHPDTSDVVWYDPDNHTSAPMYAGKAAPRDPGFTVHDFMADWSAQTGTAIEYGYSDSFGYSVSKIDGVGQPLTTEAPPYWCYKLDGTSADLGISLEPFQPGQVLTWEYAGCA